MKEIRVIRSSSFEKKVKIIRTLTKKLFGNKESVLELGGIIIGSDIFLTDCLIPKARISSIDFIVEDRDLSACWAEAEASESGNYLRPVGDLHHHPYSGCHPSASFIDKENSLQQAGLYHVFNTQTSYRKKIIKPKVLIPQGSYFKYDLDSYTCIRFPVSKTIKKGPHLLVREKVVRALWASLIYPDNAHSKFVSTYVTEHIYSSANPEQAKVTRYENVPSLIISDDEVSKRTGWPKERIYLRIDEKALEEEISEKYQIHSFSYWSQEINTHCQEDYLDQSYKYLCLTEHSRASAVAQTLRDTAVLIDEEKTKIHRTEIIKALEECVYLIKSDKV
ncbi:MAG: hypothetical protein ACMUIP_07775 [bacterium]